MKILAVNNGKGSCFHRIFLPLSSLKAKHEVMFLDKAAENFDTIITAFKPDIFYFHWGIDVAPYYLSQIKKSLGFKVILDIDDYWKPHTHVNLQNILKHAYQLELFIHVADEVTVSTQALKDKVLEIDSLKIVTVLPNEIPLKNKPERETKTVGVCGSISHYFNFIALHEVYKKILKLGYEFVFCGASTGPHWDQIRKKFDKAKFIDAVEPHEMDKLYQELDVLICPCPVSTYDHLKSSLKLKEGIVNGCKVVAAKSFQLKSDYTPVRTYSSNTQLVDIIRLGKFEAPDYDGIKAFNQVMREREDVLHRNCHAISATSEVEKMLNLDLYSIYYQEEQKPYCSFKLLYNPTKLTEEQSYLFEHKVILNTEVSTEGFVGFFSWKFGIKTMIPHEKVLHVISENLNYDVINFSPPIKNFFRFTEEVHPGFTVLFNKLCARLNLSYKETNTPIYANYFVMKGKKYDEYKKVLQEAVLILEEEDFKDVWKDSKYKQSIDLKQHTGLEHYTFHTFLLERLINAYIHTHNLKVKW